MFLSTPPSRVATSGRRCCYGSYLCFYPRHPRGWRRPVPDVGLRPHTCFYPRHPRGWRPRRRQYEVAANAVSIHATLAGGDHHSNLYTVADHVSIHATLAGGDSAATTGLAARGGVSIHATLAGGDGSNCVDVVIEVAFLSTPPSRVATGWSFPPLPCRRSFYPRHPRGWRHHAEPPRLSAVVVSIHATLAGGDEIRQQMRREGEEFLSTPPSRVATKCDGRERVPAFCFYPRHPRGWRRPCTRHKRDKFCFYPRHPRGWRPEYIGAKTGYKYVSIHATLAGGDSFNVRRCPRALHVSNHATLAGGDEMQAYFADEEKVFLSTPPSRVATHPSRKQLLQLVAFLSTPPSRVATTFGLPPSSLHFTFLSTPPSRVATSCFTCNAYAIGVSIHATLAGGDASPVRFPFAAGRFYPRHPRGWRRNTACTAMRIASFLSTPPSRVATETLLKDWRHNTVSIHATLAGGDGLPGAGRLR